MRSALRSSSTASLAVAPATPSQGPLRARLTPDLDVAKRHRKPRSYGWLMAAYESPNRMGLINRNGRVAADDRTARAGHDE